MGWLRRLQKGAAPAGTAEPDAGRLGVIAGSGALPVKLAAADPGAFVASFEGVACDLPEERLTRFRYEKLGSLFSAMKAEGVTRVVMAGALSRPQIDPKQLDLTMLRLAPRIMTALSGAGDDGLLRLVISIVEEQGFQVLGAHEILPELTARPGLLAGPALHGQALADKARAKEILGGLAPLDIGQGCVVAGGLCLGIETVQGTDALLRYVAQTPDRLRRAPGVFCKLPKAGQDLRVDMPTIGPDTLRAVAAAGIGAIVIAADKVLLMEAETLPDLARELGISILAEEL